MGTQANASAEAISLPQGGGALQGIGETFSPDLHTGTGNFSVPLSLPAGRGGFQPQLSLTYSTGTGNGPFGLGWSLGIPMVSRKTSKGVPRYRDGDVFILSGSEDLVPVPGAPGGAQRYRPRTEGIFARIDHHAAPDVWEVQGRDGLVSRYGAVQADGTRAVVSSPGGEEKVFAWCLSETVDPHGNRMVYEYERDRGSDDFHHWDQLYLRRVRYADYTDGSGDTRFLVSVELLYEDRPDPFSDHRAGFEVRTRRRCGRIEVHTHAGEDRLVRSYGLEYLDKRPGQAFLLPRNGVSLLSRVVVTGHDGAHTEQLPPLELGYTRFEPEERRFFPLRGAELPSRSLADGSLELVDLFGSGLPDFLEMDGVVRYWRNLGGGRFDRPRAMRSAPAGVRLDDPGVQLIDANGDGRTDLLVTSGPVAGYYPLAFGGEWDARSFQAYPLAPSFDLRDPEVRLVDLDGDGVTDAIRAGTRLECFFNDPVEGWGETLHVDRGALEGLRGLTFADPRVRLADMDGDGLQDVVLLHGGRVDYWPAEGRGRWGKRVVMKNSPSLPHGYDPRRILLGDVDGDGVADLVYVDDRSVTLWINRTGNGWSDPVVIRGTPRVSDVDSARLADLLGSGISGLLWSAEPRSGGDPLHFLDFTGGVKPYLLNHTDNNSGAATRVEYAPSTRFYLAAEARPETRWKTTLPFPVQVVARTEAIDLVSGGRLTSEYTYRHGYWDGEEREFRGFSRVDQRDTEVFQGPGATPDHAYSPPVETRTWFHPGPVANGAGEWTRADFTAEFWSEPFPGGAATSLLPTAAEMGVLLPDLPPRARRDALRALRGQVLRTEVYALDRPVQEDRPDLSDRPYSVTERVVGLREVDPPAPRQERSRVFFPHLLGERSTQWERGSDPMTRISFTGDYDAFGQPRLQLAVAVPRGRDPRSEGEWAEPYLATEAATGYAVPGAGGRFLADRVAHVTTREIVGARAGSVRSLWNAAVSGAPSVERRVIAQTLSFYDGEAFQGLPLGQVGSRGALVRSEQLVLTPEIVQEAYGAEVPPCFAGEGAEWSGYPEEFRALTAPGAGYVRRQAAAGSPVVAGWYAPTEQREYDFHRSAWHPRGLVRCTRDALGRETRTRYDRYQLLPRKTVDPAGLVTRSVRDYRVLQPVEVRDSNGNRTGTLYTPLGMVAATLVMGRKGEGRGDTREAPGTRYHYDLSAFVLRAQPVSVRTVQRVHHVTDTDVAQPERDQVLTRVEYSDGFGRLLQTRARAADVHFGDPAFGGGVLPADQGDAAGTAADVVGSVPPAGVPGVVVSGWLVRDNKGRVVRTYEAFFGRGWAYAPPEEAQLGRWTTTYYDALGRMERSVGPDGSEQRSVQGIPADLADPTRFAPTPWVTFAYGANDNAGRTQPAETGGYARHRDTPASAGVDALGRRVLAVARTRAAPGAELEEHRTRTVHDAQGNVREVVDPLGRTVARTVYDLAGRTLRRESLDAGWAASVHDALGREVDACDARGARTLRAYDVLGRPLRVWARDGAADALTLRERLDYADEGDPRQDPEERAAARLRNLLGHPVRHFDGAGVVVVDACDFRGNVTEKRRRVVRDSVLLQGFAAAAADHWRLAPLQVDWTPPAGVSFGAHVDALLDEHPLTTSLRHDALGRVRVLRLPPDGSRVRRELRPAYDRAGRLERVLMDGVPYVEHVAYDARGQRTLIAFGNGIMTRHAYDAQASRLVRLRSERYSRPAATVFRPLPDAPLQDLAYAYDLDGNLLRLTDRTPGCGVLNNPDSFAVQGADPVLAALLASGDALVRRFEHDPLGRLVSATGRQCAAIPAPRPWEDAPGCGFGSGGHAAPGEDNAPALTGLYREWYAYDPAGNMLRLRHETGGGAWTRHFGVGGRTPAAWDAEWRAHAAGAAWAGAPGNVLTHAGDADPAAPQSHFHDSCGNLVRQHLDRHFAWDHAGRLRLFRVQLRAAGSTPEEDRWAEPSVCAHYLYDSSGQRIKKLVRTQGGGVESTTYVDGSWERHAWSRPAGASGEGVLVHVMDDERRIATVRSGDVHPGDGGPGVRYHLGDHLGSAAVVVDGAGRWTNREEHTPFGETTFGGFARKRFRFTGQERDGESGLYYHLARYYAPWLCRWATADPAGLVDGLNLFRYSRNQPLRWVDPEGTDPVKPPVAGVKEGPAPKPNLNASTADLEQFLGANSCFEAGQHADMAGMSPLPSGDSSAQKLYRDTLGRTAHSLMSEQIMQSGKENAFPGVSRRLVPEVQVTPDGKIREVAGVPTSGARNPDTMSLKPDQELSADQYSSKDKLNEALRGKQVSSVAESTGDLKVGNGRIPQKRALESLTGVPARPFTPKFKPAGLGKTIGRLLPGVSIYIGLRSAQAHAAEGKHMRAALDVAGIFLDPLDIVMGVVPEEHLDPRAWLCHNSISSIGQLSGCFGPSPLPLRR